MLGAPKKVLLVVLTVSGLALAGGACGDGEDRPGQVTTENDSGSGSGSGSSSGSGSGSGSGTGSESGDDHSEESTTTTAGG